MRTRDREAGPPPAPRALSPPRPRRRPPGAAPSRVSGQLGRPPPPPPPPPAAEARKKKKKRRGSKKKKKPKQEFASVEPQSLRSPEHLPSAKCTTLEPPVFTRHLKKIFKNLRKLKGEGGRCIFLFLLSSAQGAEGSPLETAGRRGQGAASPVLETTGLLQGRGARTSPGRAAAEGALRPGSNRSRFFAIDNNITNNNKGSPGPLRLSAPAAAGDGRAVLSDGGDAPSQPCPLFFFPFPFFLFFLFLFPFSLSTLHPFLPSSLSRLPLLRSGPASAAGRAP